MDWKDISKLVGGAAPILGTLLGGPAGAAVGGLIASALGTPGGDADAVHAAISADPGAALKLATIESDNRVKLQGMQLDHADRLIVADTVRVQADVDDRKSAREREVSVRDRTPAILGWTVVMASVVLGVAVVSGFVTKDPALAGIVGTVVGCVFSEARQVLNYFFGSNSSAARTTELLASSTPGK